jgi:hypothetical protein
MPTNRSARARGARRRHINDAALEAWRRADYLALHRALKLHPGSPSPLPSTITPLGVDREDPPDDDSGRAWDRGWYEALELQEALLAVAGFPDCRAAYEENLRQAEERAAYCRELVDNSNKGGQGTGRDPLSRLLALDEAEAEVAWRQQLLDELPN